MLKREMREKILRRKQAFVIQVQSRIFKFEKEVRSYTQNLREQWIGKLNSLFNLATSIANPDEKSGEKALLVAPKEETDVGSDCHAPRGSDG